MFRRAVASFVALAALTSRVIFLFAKLYQYMGKYDKNSAPLGKIRSLKLSIALKLGWKQTKLHKEMYL